MKSGSVKHGYPKTGSYVYQYIRDDGTPYYIGKGKGPRAFDHHGKIGVPKDKSRIIFLHTNLSDSEAIALEIELIRFYGRKDKKTGILRNMTDGGEGMAGIIVSEETRRKLSIALTGKKLKPFSEEHRRKLSEAKKNSIGNNTGTKLSEESKKKISKARKGIKTGPPSAETRTKIGLALKASDAFKLYIANRKNKNGQQQTDPSHNNFSNSGW